VILTAVLAVVGVLQWSVYRQQKAIMEASGHQTDQLIDYAAAQACAASQSAQAADRFARSSNELKDKFGVAVGDFEKAAKQSATAAQGSADNAKQAISTAQETFRGEQRAWLNITTGIDPITDFTKPPNGVIHITNNGKTPALNVRIDGHFTPSPKEILDGKLLVHKHGPEYRSVGLVAPGTVYDSNSMEATPLNVSNPGVNDTWLVYIWGDITYCDVFKRQHFVRFCGVRKMSETAFIQCLFHNEIDDQDVHEDCKP
jgi:hypothetical protein